jgi:hypothetical protein
MEQANCGKSDGDIRFWPNGVLQFTYYFNPRPNDKNLEFDATRNLFGELPVDQMSPLPNRRGGGSSGDAEGRWDRV